MVPWVDVCMFTLRGKGKQGTLALAFHPEYSFYREAAKKVLFLVAQPLRLEGEG